MQHIFTILPNRAANRSFERYFKFAHQAQLHAYQMPAAVGDKVSDEDICVWVTDTFAKISGWLNSKIHENDLSSGIGIIELYDERLTGLDRLNPLHTRQTWSAAAAMLILAFPEIYWIFISPHPLGKTAGVAPENKPFDKFHRVRFLSDEAKRLNLNETLKIGGANFSPLFDPFGFRNLIRKSIRRTDESDSSDTVDYIPRRKQTVVSIDEEEDYAGFVSYIAYRFGYRAMQINSFAALRELNGISPEKFHIAFEDMFLNFPDQPAGSRLSNLKKRHEKFLLPEKINKFVRVTSGHDQSLDKDTKDENEDFLKQFKEKGRLPEINKPFSGIFKFWYEADQYKNGKPELGEEYEDDLKKMRQSKPEDEPRTPADMTGQATQGIQKRSKRIGHSATGRLLMIANCLIKRATRLAENANTAKDATRGATLALEAIEYLGYRTPTVSLQALSLKNKLEVMAEAMFYGVGYSISQKERFKEIEKEIEAIGKWYKKNGSAEINAEIKIINDMALVFQRQGLFDEDNECMSKIRDLYRKLSKSRKQANPPDCKPVDRNDEESIWVNIKQKLFRHGHDLLKRLNDLIDGFENFILWYANQLLNSIWNFLIAVSCWVAFFAFIFALVLGFSNKKNYSGIKLVVDCLGHGLYDACVAFFSLQPAHDMSGAESEKVILVSSIFCIIISYFHLGILISYVYSLLTRRQ